MLKEVTWLPSNLPTHPCTVHHATHSPVSDGGTRIMSTQPSLTVTFPLCARAHTHTQAFSPVLVLTQGIILFINDDDRKGRPSSVPSILCLSTLPFFFLYHTTYPPFPPSLSPLPLFRLCTAQFSYLAASSVILCP